jgi:large subunit ribosomal protein L4
MSTVLEHLKLDASVLILLPAVNQNLELSARNLPNVKTLRANCLSVRDILGYDYVMLTRDAVDMVHTLLDVAK